MPPPSFVRGSGEALGVPRPGSGNRVGRNNVTGHAAGELASRPREGRLRADLIPPWRPYRMTDTLPDRLSNNPNSPYYNEEILAKGVGIRFNGVEETNVDEYCVSEGWIRVVAGNAKDRFGNPMTLKLKGKVEPYLQGEA